MSAFRLSPKLRRRAILAALIAPLPTPASRDGTAPAVHQTSRLVFRLGGPTHQDVIGSRQIAFVAHCPEDACRVAASVTSKSPSFTTATVHANVAAKGSERVLVPLAKRQRGKLRAALEAGHAPILTVHATARDSAGNEVPLTLTIHPKKP